MLKATGVILVVVSCSMIGFEFAARLKKRSKNLENIKKGIVNMERDMQFFKQPLHEVFKKAGENVSKEAGKLFLNVAEKLKKDSCNAETVWKNEVEQMRDELCFSKEEATKIKNIFSGLGKTDSLSQKKIMVSSIENMQTIIDECNKTCEKNIKVYKGLGVLSGLLVALIFI